MEIPPETAWVPDWKDKTQYPDPAKLTALFWAWEFESHSLRHSRAQPTENKNDFHCRCLVLQRLTLTGSLAIRSFLFTEV
jgi:hypothetical protein